MRASVSLLCILLCSGQAIAQAPIVEGQALYQSCVACHGAEGQGNAALQSPAIAGLPADYISRQLNHFKNKTRGVTDEPLSMQMQVASQLLTSQADIEAVSAYLAQLAVPQLDESVNGNARRGQTLYNGNCGACHGPAGEGNPNLHAPRLSNQSADYLIRQVKGFQAGHRGADKNDKYGRQMAMMAGTINPERDLADILSFLQEKNKAD